MHLHVLMYSVLLLLRFLNTIPASFEVYSTQQCDQLLKSRFKQWWQKCPPIFTKRTTTYHLKSSKPKKITTYGDGNPDPGLGQVDNNMAGLNR